MDLSSSNLVDLSRVTGYDAVQHKIDWVDNMVAEYMASHPRRSFVSRNLSYQKPPRSSRQRLGLRMPLCAYPASVSQHFCSRRPEPWAKSAQAASLRSRVSPSPTKKSERSRL